MNKILICLLILLFSINVYSLDRVLGTPDVLDEFSRTEESIKHKQLSKENRDKTLKKNLTTAVKYSIHKKYLDSKERIKDLRPDSIKFYQDPGTYNYVIQYKEYYGYYYFAVDPELYIQLPVDERFYSKQGDSEPVATTPAAPPAKSTPTNDVKVSPGPGPNKPLMDGKTNP